MRISKEIKPNVISVISEEYSVLQKSKGQSLSQRVNKSLGATEGKQNKKIKKSRRDTTEQYIMCSSKLRKFLFS